MYRNLYFLFLFIFSFSKIFPQDYSYLNSFGKFKNASSFYITTAGIIYLTDSGTDEVYKLDTLGNIMKYAGGYGWDEGLFDNPSDVFANPLSVYVCDKNNHRIERFDKDLNFIWQLSTHNSDTTDQRFGYPLGCAVSQQGDLYILDSENRRIIKFDLFGNFVQNFGGYDAGNFSLINPQKIAVSLGNKIYVIDKNRIVIFDQYGNGLSIIKMDSTETGINIILNKLTVNNNGQIYYADLNSAEISLSKINLIVTKKPDDIVSSLIFNNKLYVLTKNEIYVFNKIE